MMTNSEIFEIAVRQSATDLSCEPTDLTGKKNKTVISKKNGGERKYLELPFICDIVSYGGNAVASTSEEHADAVNNYINSYPAEHLFETPNMHVLNDYFEKRGARVCFMAEYFLPDVEKVRVLPCGYETKLLYQRDFEGLYLPEWSNALCKKRKELDVLGVGAYDGRKLVGFAGCSADCELMWQIGIDVLPQYRRQGIASALTSRLAYEVLERGKVPFYCAAWSNIPSVRNAIRSGFRPAWAEMTVKPREFTDRMNTDSE